MSAARGGVVGSRRPQRTTAGSYGKWGDYTGPFNTYEQQLTEEQWEKSQLPATRVDLNKLKVQTLRKYTKQFEVQGVHPTSSKEDIAKAVSDHWNSVQITEEAVLQNLLKVRGRY